MNPSPQQPPSILVRLARSKILITCLIVLPSLYPAYPLFTQNPTVLADPAKYLLEYAGKTGTLLLISVLSLTPLRLLFPRSKLVNAFNRHRRRIGVSAFFYVTLHLFFYFVYEGGFSTLPENLKKPFILSGATAFLILLLLASTSTNWAVRRLGGRLWKRIHRLVYVAALLVVFHQAEQEKIGAVQTVYFFAPLGVLQIVRVFKVFGGRVGSGKRVNSER